jgi:circadian clock protein KaiC
LTLLISNVPRDAHGISDLDASYLADTVVAMRSFDANGLVRGCISVLKKRHGRHEKSIRELAIGQGGIRLGPPLSQFRGMLTATPEYVGGLDDLMTRSSLGAGDEPG